LQESREPGRASHQIGQIKEAKMEEDDDVQCATKASNDTMAESTIR